MLKSSSLVAAMMIVLTAACAEQEADLDLDPACEDATKCDGGTQGGFEVFEGLDDRWYFHMLSKNGRIILRSQAYSSKQSATRGVESVRENGVDAENFKMKQAANGEWYVNLYAQNHEIIATTETYTRKFNAMRAIDTSVAIVSEAQRVRAAASGARFQTMVGADYQSYFQLRGRNGEVMLASSEGYVNTANAIAGTAAVREHGKIAARYHVLQAADSQWYFHLKASNGEIIGRGETYASKSNAQRAVDTLVELLRSELVADARPAEAPVRTLTGRAELVQTLGALADIASFGVELAHFGFAEQAIKPAGVECQPATAAQLNEEFGDAVAQIMVAGPADRRPDLTPAVIAASKTQMADLLGTDSYELCEREVESSQTKSVEMFMLSKRADGPKIVFEIGYEVRDLP
jgi:uncharacterized protein YegP (UPF0339 family)